MADTGLDLHRQAVRDIDQTPFKQLHISAPQALSQSRRNRPNSSGGRNQTSAMVGRGSGRTKMASPRPLMARKAFSSVWSSPKYAAAASGPDSSRMAATASPLFLPGARNSRPPSNG